MGFYGWLAIHGCSVSKILQNIAVMYSLEGKNLEM